MSTASHRSHQSAASLMGHVAEPRAPETVAECLKQGPRGALALASVSVGLLFIGWLAFYFLLFIPRGSVG
jgi:hypothetical protein